MARYALLLALVLPLTASAATPSFEFFQTPSHNIGCVYSGSPRYLRCDIRTGLKPPPPRPKGCQNDWTFGYQVSKRGPARGVCAGDTVLSPSARVIPYGRTWRRGPFVCRSRATGLLCRNSTRHGFILNRDHSFRFGATRLEAFHLPSWNIGCQYAYRSYVGPSFIRCDVNGGIKPLPPKPRSCAFEWGPGFSMKRTGTVSVVCGSDTVLSARPNKPLPYGQTWRRWGFSCTSRAGGLTCRNAARHGFFLSRQHSYRY
jgi:hypothetical protein